MTDPIADIFGAVAGRDLHGGCDYCDAGQRLQQDAPHVWTLVIVHEDRCPKLRRARARDN